ncbi:hypothetical protein BKI52_09880 [marine bacterium AO1-C]|nr:hypothetical protein BKI52_09880 [marine bacterium AO1-C]
MILVSFFCHAQRTYTVNNSSQAIQLLHNYLEILEDTTNQLTYPEVQHKPFVLFNKFGAKTKARYSYWGRITLQSQLNQDQKFVFYLGSANVGDVYIKTGSQLIKEKTGRLIPFSQKKIKQGRNAPVPVLLYKKANKQPTTIYFRFKNLDDRPPLIDPKLYTVKAWYTKFKTRNLLLGGFNALLWTLLLYQISLFFLTKYRVYLYASLYLFFTSINNLSTSGILPEFLLGEYPRINEATWLLAWTSLGIFHMALCRSFARTYLYLKTWDFILKWFMRLLVASLIVASIGIALTFRIGLFQQVNFVTGLFMIVFLPFFAVAVMLKKIKGTLLFNIGVIQTSVLIAISYSRSILNTTSISDSRLDLIGVAIQGILFTIALAQRLKLVEEEKDATQASQATLIAQQNETLETKVKERTKELEEKNEEIQIYHYGIVMQNEWLQSQQEEIKRQQESLNQKNKYLLEQNRLISQSIEVAQTIQSAILPDTQFLEQVLGEYFMIYRPKDVVSGDFYWLQQADSKVFLAIVDCTGHGVPGAFMSMIGNTLLSQIIQVQEVHSPAEILNRLHKEITTTLQQEETHNIYGMEMVLLVWEPDTTLPKEFVFCGAKSHLMYVLPDTTELRVIKGDRRGIGGYQPQNVFFSDQPLEFPNQTMIYLGSDGFKDQNDPQRKKIGQEKLEEVLSKTAHLPVKDQKQHLEHLLNTHQQSALQRDDIMLLGFRIS